MKAYLDSLREVIELGFDQGNRTCTNTRVRFGITGRYDIDYDAFPIVTTKKINFDHIVNELLWFIHGCTNSDILSDMGTPIWDPWALKEDVNDALGNTLIARGELGPVYGYMWRKWPMYKTIHVTQLEEYRLDGWELVGPVKMMELTTIEEEDDEDEDSDSDTGTEEGVTKEEFMELYLEKTKYFPPLINPFYNEHKAWGTFIIKKFLKLTGKTEEDLKNENPKEISAELDKIRKQYVVVFKEKDQLAELIENLRTMPLSRRHILTAYNPTYNPDESLDHEENIIAGNQVLSPCHTMIQFHVKELSLVERLRYATKRYPQFEIKASTLMRLDNGLEPDVPVSVIEHNLMKIGVGKYSLSGQLYQRSADMPVGVPYNISSYSLLIALIAREVGMVPGEFIHNIGNAHIYHDQLELAKMQILRTPHKLPALWINPEVDSMFDLTGKDIKLVNYTCDAFIKYPVAV